MTTESQLRDARRHLRDALIHVETAIELCEAAGLPAEVLGRIDLSKVGTAKAIETVEWVLHG